MSALDALTWPASRAPEALYELARLAGFAPTAPRALGALETFVGDDPRALALQLEASAAEMQLEAEPVEVPYAEAETFLARAAPALVRIAGAAGEERLLAIVGRGRRSVHVLAPDLSRARLSAAELRARWCAALERALDPLIEPVLDAAELSPKRRSRSQGALAREHLAAVVVGGAWLVRLAPGRSLALQARAAGLGARAIALVASSFFSSLASIAAWIVLGRGALSGRFEAGWIAAWVLLLASTIPLRALEAWLQGDIAIRFGALFKRRLLAGAARLDPEAVRGEGAGHLLGRVLESEAFETVALGVGFQALGATIDAGLATWALANGPAPLASLALFAAFLALAIALGTRHLARLQRFAAARLAMTQDLVERMVGHRTRIAQEDPRRWHAEEDRLLERYLERSRALDTSSVQLTTLLAGAWLVLGLALVAASFLRSDATPIALAIGLGGALLGQQALGKLCGALTQVGTCVVAWRVVRPLYRAAVPDARREPLGLPGAALRPEDPSPTRALLEARGLAFRHAGREHAVLADVDLMVQHGERVLVEGPSGGGKSTLAALISGWREASAGLLLLSGLDRQSHGAHGWRRRVAAAPQFHENHVFTGSLAFNLMLGASETSAGNDAGTGVDHERALQVCRELGLDELVARMPSGLQQIVGETGWQLSHGEKSRLYIARALLQGGGLVVLDESLAALDPETLRRALGCVLRRANSLIVIAHP